MSELSPLTSDEVIQSLIDSRITWRDLKYNNFLERSADFSTDELSRILQSPDVLNSMISSGSFPVNKLGIMVAANIKNLAIDNAKISPIFRTYKAVVAKSGGDFTEIQPAIDYVHANGGGRILLRAGTYRPMASITMYSDIQIFGESRNTTIIDFQDNEISMNFIDINNSGLYSVGFLYDIDYVVKITGTSSRITIKDIYLDHTGGGIYISSSGKYNVVDDIYINELVNRHGIYISNGSFNQIRNLHIYVNDTSDINGINLIGGSRITFSNIYVEKPKYGFNITGGGPFTFMDCRAKGGLTANGVAGWNIAGTTDLVLSKFIGCGAEYFTTDGWTLNGVARCSFIGCDSHHNTQNGFNCANIDDDTFTGGQIVDNGAYGFDLDANSSINAIVGNYIRFNSSGNTRDLGTSNVIASNAS